MHILFLVEDMSGRTILDHVIRILLDEPNTYEIRAWRGLGRLPANLHADPDPRKRTLLDKLPALLRAAGKQFQAYDGSVVVVVDLDARNKHEFLADLTSVHDACNPKPNALFRLAIEEMEAWLLGDRLAVKQAYPRSKDDVLNKYVQDSICGTWELMADAVHPGGVRALKASAGYARIGAGKHEWADRVGRHMAPARNVSPSFRHFTEGVRQLIGK